MSEFSLEQLTEGIRQRNVGSAGRQLVDKWSRTGLLRGLQNTHRENMARLLENQAAQVLREVSSVGQGGGSASASGDLRGFTNIAFPIVRRVFGGLIANDLVSIQPMSLPSGLLFYLDYTSGADVGATPNAGGGATGSKVATAGDSLYGDQKTPVNQGSEGRGSKYDLTGLGQSRNFVTDASLTIGNAAAQWNSRLFSVPSDGTPDLAEAGGNQIAAGGNAMTGLGGRLMQFDAAVENDIANGAEYNFLLIPLTTTNFTGLDTSMVKEIALGQNGTNELIDANTTATIQGGDSVNVRRLNQIVKITNAHDPAQAVTPAAIKEFVPAPLAKVGDANAAVLMVIRVTDSTGHQANDLDAGAHVTVAYPQASTLDSSAGAADTLVVPAMESIGGDSPSIPEIDIKVEAVPVVAETRKLRAKWSPELAQDLNAYHSLDAEVELTQILSEQIALEIDREILNDLLTQAGAANFFWSRQPGDFVNKETAATVSASFTGTVREWYETLVETIIDVANQIHRKTLRGSANFIVVGPDVATILEASVFYKPSYSIDGDGQVSQPMTIGADQVGTLSNRFTVYKDPYFPRNKILVGYKGGSYLETGYVYAPYVPLIVTPTIFQPEDFTPRKGVMTRYGKKMVRADFYGTVTCLKMNVI